MVATVALGIASMIAFVMIAGFRSGKSLFE